MKHARIHKEFLERIRLILLEVWDPVGIGDNPLLRSEYDTYLSDISKLILDTSTTVDVIARHLMYIEQDKMGLPGHEQTRLEAAKALANLVYG